MARETEESRYYLGKFKNCNNCIRLSTCKLRKKHNAFNCGMFKRDVVALLGRIKINEAIRLKNERNDRSYDKYLQS